MFAVEQFDIYLFKHFTIRTDHQPLKWIKSIKSPKGKIARWLLKLQGYDFSVKHISGKRNVWADFMSRAPELNELNVLQEGECKLTEDEELKAVLEAHRLTGHAGKNATHLFLKERMRFPDMYAMVSQVAVTARHV